MPTETQARDLLHRTADQLDVGPAPIDALLATPARRRRRVAVTVAGVAAAAVVAAVAVIGPGGEGSRAPTPPAGGPASLQVSPGMRLVGQGDLTVEVPESWPVVGSECPMAVTGVVFDRSAGGCFAADYSDHSTLHVASYTAAVAALGGEWLAEKAGPLDDAAQSGAYRADPVTAVCAGGPGTDCPGLFRGAVVDPASDVVLWVESSDKAVVDQVIGSARLIPDGFVAVPSDPTPEALTELGLVVEPADFDPTPPAGAGADWSVSSDLPPGSVVETGTLVTLSAPDVEPMTIVRAVPACGPTDGPAVLVTLEATRRFDVHVILAVGDDVIGKMPARVFAGRSNNVLVPLAEKFSTPVVTVQVFGQGMAMDKSLLAQQDGVAVRPSPGCG